MFAEKGIKRTEQRDRIFKILADSKKPMTAEEIFKACDGISLATVYRTLDTFLEKGILEKISFEDSDKRYFEVAGNAHRHYAVCLGCRHMEYIDICPVHGLNIDNFQITGHRLEIYGYCKDCRPKITV